MDQLAVFLTKLIGELPERPAAEAAFQRGHLFQSILRYCSQDEDIVGRMDMMYHFTMYQQCLSQLRAKRAQARRYWLDRIRTAPLRLHSENAKTGMDALYFPLMGNKEYLDGNWAAAKKYQRKAMRALEQLLAAGMNDALAGLLEQKLNLFRVLCVEGSYQEALDLAVDLMTFLHTAQYNREFGAGDLYAILDSKEFASFGGYFLDGILRKLLPLPDQRWLHQFLQQVAACPHDWLSHDVQQAFVLLASLSETPDWSRAPAGFALGTLSHSLQLCVLMALRSHCGGEQHAVWRTRIDAYCKAWPYQLYRNFSMQTPVLAAA